MTGTKTMTTTLALLLAAMLLASCGGGGGSGQPSPQPNLPDPVEAVSDADLSTAGIPSVASLASSSAARNASISVASADVNGDGISDIVTTKNIVLGQDGSDLLLQVPDSELEKRIVGWAMYRVDFGDDGHLAWVQAGLESGGNARWFFAIANPGNGRWEVGGRIFTDGFESGQYNADGTHNPSAQYNFRRSFSQSQDYCMADGSVRFLLIAAHPGTSSVSGYINNTELWDWRKFRNSASDGFGSGENGSIQWNSAGSEGGGLWNDSVGTMSYIEQGNVYRQDFSFDDTSGSERLLFALPVNLLPDGEPGEPTTALNSVDASDYNLWRNGFFNPGELNGWQHPFSMLRAGGGIETNNALNAAPFMQLPGSQSLGIIAILIGITGPIPDAELSMQVAGEEISIKTGKAGQLTIPLNFFGTDTFTYTLKYDGGSQPLEVELELDPEAGIYRFR
ncbi:MAG: hypothetical protein H7A35_08175 [Planctomycetales bacterium]|nr:hypothetical protein [bacterium]UNM06861.1 MAG: hypothetical protein H7A35_08175 [Planctomycetales bacterium]